MTITKGDQPSDESAAPAAGGESADPAGSRPATARDPRVSAMTLSGLIALVLGVTAAVLPVPYVVESPGPTFNTLGQDNGKPVISITGRDTYPAEGNLNLTTVYVDGGPNGPVSVFEAFSAWIDGSKAVYPQELIFPTGVTKEQSQQESAVAMTTSQENAVASALKELDIPFGQKLEVAELSEGSASQGKLKPGDVFTSINGKPITSLSVVQDELAAGTGKPAVIVVEREGKAVTETVTPARSDSGRFILGVLLKYRFTFPFDVKISLEKVGGPSAGMMFALGIIDTVTPGDLTGGKHIAGTGTISPDGVVGPIGGVAVKMHGARADGATMFLAPAANCAEVSGHVPEGLQVVKVENLDEAKRAVELAASGGDTSGLPACANN
ncbi:YlbL family protein [Arthrobacter pascens]|uniref:YlbL family protein n=1 Tax=Arthrobacter pascens TaxID=1677 RepID=UPI0027DC30AB|nr:PDZ domain-containing protein [Arthrobacter pascens]MDR6556187.1 PDZ domain-containing protein [Arthrobacter pascens]